MSWSNRHTSLLHWLVPRKRQNRRRRDGPQAQPHALQEILSHLEPTVIPHDAHRPAVDPDVWRGIVGQRIADRSWPQRLDADGTLVVQVSSSVWAQELSLLSGTIMDRLAPLGLRARQLRFAVGRVTPQRRGPTRFEHRRVEAPAPLPEAVALQLLSVEDPELRQAIATAAKASLGQAEADTKRRANSTGPTREHKNERDPR
ncbi:MAG: DUF721 domain-containing protein [Polyangiaceae bacterium]|jgi:hypothetical protein|nr:DUF721 domain-containing protein [Polyangiaceae bacterium]